MKKYLVLLVGLLSFINISTVKADTLGYSTYYDNFDDTITLYLQYQDKVEELISIWESDYSSTYPYYFITIDSNRILLYYCETPNTRWDTRNLIHDYGDDGHSAIMYNIIEDTISYMTQYVPVYFRYSSSTNDILINNGMIYNNIPHTWSIDLIDYTSDFDYIEFPSFTSETYDFSVETLTIEEGDILPAYLDLYNGTYNKNLDTYTEINLNNYAYVALTLKDYSQTEQFSTNVYVKGNYCLTPVYNYGMEEKSEYYSGYQVDRCSPYYEDYTLVRTYILEQDLENHAIYYLKAYDISKENYVKIDNSVFNITYITEEEKDNPYVIVDGKTYPTISYDDLSSSSTKSEDEGYISGVSCAVGDFNCYEEYNPSNIFDDLFNKPLEVLKSVWTAITSIFALITSFILLLPETMQGFLYVAFGISIILGIIKIIL